MKKVLTLCAFFLIQAMTVFAGGRDEDHNNYHLSNGGAAATQRAPVSVFKASSASQSASSFDTIESLITEAHNQSNKINNVGLNFDGANNYAIVVAVLQYQDSNITNVKPGNIFIVDKNGRGLMLYYPTSDNNKYDAMSSLKVGDVITGTLAGNYSETSNLPRFEVRKSVNNGSGSGKVTYTSNITINTDGEATDNKDAVYPVNEIENVNALAKTNFTDLEGNTNTGDVTKTAYGPYLNTMVSVHGTIRADKGQYYLLQSETETDVDDQDLYRIYISADELPGINLADYEGTTGEFEGLLIKRNNTEAKLSATNLKFMQVTKFNLSELDDEMRVYDLVSNGAISGDVDVYVHRTKLVTPGDNAFATICLPFNLTSEEFKTVFGCDIELLAKATSTVSSDGVQQFESISSKAIEAGVPYLLKASGTQTDGNGSDSSADNYWAHVGTKSITVANPIKTTASYGDNIVNGEFYFCGLFGKKQYTTGEDGLPTTTYVADNGSQKYQYISTSDGTLRYLAASSTLAFNGLRAYYYFPSWDKDNNNAVQPSGNKSRLKIAINDKTVTAIDGISIDNATTAPIYNISGQKVGNDRTALPKGLYIQNGKKFIVK